jgi:uncharacterized membrane protein HdeD (DUF308 family)
MAADSVTDALKEATGMSIGWAILMLVLGVVAIAMPFTTGIAVSIFVGWIMVFSGFAYVAYAFGAQGAGSFIWRLLVGIAYVAGGGYIVFRPGIGLESLTLVMASIFFIEGVIETAVFFQFRSLPGSGWILFDGLLTFVLAYLIFRPWPSSSSWAIGTLLGINLIVSGVTRLMYSVTARKTIKAVAA